MFYCTINIWKTNSTQIDFKGYLALQYSVFERTIFQKRVVRTKLAISTLLFKTHIVRAGAKNGKPHLFYLIYPLCNPRIQYRCIVEATLNDVSFDCQKITRNMHWPDTFYFIQSLTKISFFFFLLPHSCWANVYSRTSQRTSSKSIRAYLVSALSDNCV